MWILIEFLFDEYKNYGVCIEYMYIYLILRYRCWTNDIFLIEKNYF